MVSEETKKRGLGPAVGGLLLLVVALGVAFWGISTRAKALSEVTKETRETAIPSVAVIAPERGAPRQEVTLPGTLEAFTDAPIFARTNGYLRKRYVDIGAKVRAGQVLADIDTPEVDQQLEQARADLATAEANERLAQLTAERYRDLIKTDSVSKQDLDNANGSLEARVTAVNSSKANVRRLEQLHAFGRITAPFDGVITARNVDLGALIDSGSNAKELFHEAAVHRLRLFVNVPEVYSRAAVAGMTADLTLTEFPGRTFAGTLARTAQAIDVASRTLLTEIDVENAKGELLPGSYAEVHLKVSSDADTFKLPVNAVMFRTEGVQVAVVDPNGRVKLQPITLGRDYGNALEVVSGLTGSERIIVNPPDSIESGETVRVAESAQP
ncbi:MAG TPA: efflux RND transporter periplasmic adaptor subunit [Vicinamibacterales bacterium]|jgi:RND family efflux transporter MFP subunit|nr:efflux RND transporter periplasmic adaptor subunit [Vicinamibacterales bacterium]